MERVKELDTDTKENKMYLPILEIIYEWVEETNHPDIVMYKTNSLGTLVGLIDVTNGVVIAKECIQEGSLAILYDNAEIAKPAISFINESTGEYNVYVRKLVNNKVIYKCIHHSFNYELVRLMKDTIVLSNRYDEDIIVTLNGRRYNKKSYLRVIDVERIGKLIGLNFLKLTKGRGDVIRSIDILNRFGDIEEENVTDTKYIEARFGIGLTHMYSRKLNTIKW